MQERAIKEGKVTGTCCKLMHCMLIHAPKVTKCSCVAVNGEMVTVTTVLRDNDLLCHRVHRHEPPVSAQPVEVVHEDADILVVNKPSSIPVRAVLCVCLRVCVCVCGVRVCVCVG